MSSVEITHPAPDGNGTSIVINCVEVNTHIAAGGVTVEFRKDLPPLVTLRVPARELKITGNLMLDVDDVTKAILKSAGWSKSAEGGVIKGMSA